MVTSTAPIALILAYTFLLMFLAQGFGTSGAGQHLFSIAHDNEVEAEQPSGNVDQPHLIEQGEDDGGFGAEAPANRRLGKHKGTDPSVAGGGVILGGLAMAVFAAVFSYIRVTRKRTAAVNT